MLKNRPRLDRFCLLVASVLPRRLVAACALYVLGKATSGRWSSTNAPRLPAMEAYARFRGRPVPRRIRRAVRWGGWRLGASCVVLAALAGCDDSPTGPAYNVTQCGEAVAEFWRPGAPVPELVKVPYCKVVRKW